MEQTKINTRQLFILAIMFELGSSAVIPVGTSAMQDVWLVVLIGLVLGMALFLVYYRLSQYYPGDVLTVYTERIVGVWPGRVLAVIYIVYFLYLTARVLRNFGELLLMFAYMETPLIILNAIMMLTVIYAIYKGIEVVARTGELYIIGQALATAAGFALVIMSGIMNLNLLKPVLQAGWGQIWKTAATETTFIPFGEMIVFTMLFPLVNRPERTGRTLLAAMLISGLILAAITTLNVTVLGAETVARSVFPLLDTVRRIEVARFLERFDAFFMIVLIVGGFFKASVYFYAAVEGTVRLFRMRKQHRLVYPLGLLVLIISLATASNFAEHLKEGLQISTMYLHIPLQVVVPIVLLCIAAFRRRKAERKDHSGDKSDS